MLFCIKDKSTWINWQKSEFLLTASLAEQRTSSWVANCMPKLPVVHHRQNDSFEAHSIWILNQLVCVALRFTVISVVSLTAWCSVVCSFSVQHCSHCSSESRFAARVGRLQKIVADIRVWGLWWEGFEIKSAGLKGEGFVCCAEHGRHLNL